MTPVSRLVAAAGIALLAAAAPVTAGTTADKATGGGQILVSSTGRGPGDTIAFTAQERANGVVSGNVNVIDRVQGATGKGVHFKGDVTCIEAVGNVAKIGGLGRFGDGTSSGFVLIVTDNGQGSAASNDTITLQYTEDVTCEREDGDNDGAVELARGNAQVTDGH